MSEADPIPVGMVGHYTVAKTFELTPRPMMAYAAGVGDVRACYFDDLQPDRMIGHPGMAFSFMFNTGRMPDVPLGPRVEEFGVHAWTDVRYHRPFRLGDVLAVQGRCIGVRQIAPGALTVTRTTMVDSSGAVVAEMDDGVIFPTGKADGPDREIAAPPPLPERSGEGVEPLWSVEIPVRPEATYVYTECADIWDRIHTERQVARRSGLPDIILQGSATMAFAMRELIDRCLEGEPTRLLRVAGRFRAMVFPGRPMTVRCLERRDKDGAREVFFDVLNHEGGQAIQNGVLVGR